MDLETVGVYKTDVCDASKASLIEAAIHLELPRCRANFDLEDCDRILRIENLTDVSDEQKVVQILGKFHHSMEMLPDVSPEKSNAY